MSLAHDMSDLRTTFIIWEDLKGSMPDPELKRMEEQATRFLATLRQIFLPDSVILIFGADGLPNNGTKADTSNSERDLTAQRPMAENRKNN